MNPVPLLFVDHAPAMGGAENSLKLLLEHLDTERWEVHLACTDGPLAHAVTGMDVHLHQVQLPSLRHSVRAPVNWWRGVNRLAHIARDIHARVVVANTVRSAFYAGPAARLAATRFIWMMRDFWLSESKPRHTILDLLGKRVLCYLAHTVITNSHATAAHLSCSNKVHVIHNGIDIENFVPQPDSHTSRKLWHIADDWNVVGTIGRLRPWKGQLRFLHVLKAVLVDVPNTVGMIIGGAPFQTNDGYVEQLHQAVTDLDLQDHVIFTGHLTDIRSALAAMDIFVHPGDPEPFGLVNIEAMAMAKPVIAFAHGALPEIVADGETGILIPPVDIRAMAQAICSLLHNPSQQKTMGSSGRHRAEQLFSITRTARAFDRLLSPLIE
ncbi:MAG: glycosyltransferase family 4 protein [Anaerolineae bacterium]|nr:glycosyltransferase family 4 protein [Anaerolineae bacterium]